MSGFPLLSPEEAKARLPTLRPMLARLREAFDAYRFAKAQWDEMRAFLGADVDVASHPDHAEAQRWREERDARFREVEAIVQEINALGADVKDPILGLVDFFTPRGNDVVLLCYRDDEDDIRFWHPVETGFAGRRPLEEL